MKLTLLRSGEGRKVKFSVELFYHHDGEDEGRDEVGDGENANRGADGKADGRTAESRHEQRHTEQQELEELQPESFTHSVTSRSRRPVLNRK